MTTPHPIARPIFAATLALALAGCGGGGGDGPPPPPVTVDISVANRDSVAHAVATAAFGLGAANLSFGQAIAVQRRAAQQVASVAKKKALGVIGPVVDNCLVSGSVSTTLDDRDSNLQPSVGDVLTLEFRSCRDSADEVVDGRVDAIYTGISVTPAIGVTAQLAMTALSSVQLSHSVRLDGVLDLTYAEDGGNIASTRLEADGPVTARVVTPTFSDTVTLLSGFAVQGIYDASVPPPAGGANPGRTRSIVSGRLDSAAAGGIVLVATESALVQYTDDANPRSGRISVTGSTGTLRVVVLNSDSVRIEVDADDNGTFENAVVADWDWLL